MIRVGLTGGIGSGKSTVSALLRQRGAVVIDSDELAREAVAPGTDGLAEVAEAFGSRVLAADGSLDRQRMAALVFQDPAARGRLEEIVHPRVRSAAAALERTASREDPDSVIVHDVPLLIETGRHTGFDVVVVVDVPVDVAQQRLVEQRGLDPADAERRVAAQASREARRAIADVVLDNSGTVADIERQVDRLWNELSSRAAT